MRRAMTAYWSWSYQMTAPCGLNWVLDTTQVGTTRLVGSLTAVICHLFAAINTHVESKTVWRIQSPCWPVPTKKGTRPQNQTTARWCSSLAFSRPLYLPSAAGWMIWRPNCASAHPVCIAVLYRSDERPRAMPAAPLKDRDEKRCTVPTATIPKAQTT